MKVGPPRARRVLTPTERHQMFSMLGVDAQRLRVLGEDCILVPSRYTTNELWAIADELELGLHLLQL